MTIADNLKEHSAEVIEEYLTAAEWCINEKKANGGILGYPAMLLLFCATDAIGHGILPSRPGDDPRLEILIHPNFGLKLNDPDSQLKLLKKVYRNSLTHNGQLWRDAYMTPDIEGEPFDFSPDGTQTLIRVPVFCKVVKCGWNKSKADYNPKDRHQRPLPPLPAQTPDPFYNPTISSGRHR
jgi:hypothetical protein